MMPAAKRASYFFSAPSTALPPAPEAVPAPKNLPSGGDMPVACNGGKSRQK